MLDFAITYLLDKGRIVAKLLCQFGLNQSKCTTLPLVKSKFMWTHLVMVGYVTALLLQVGVYRDGIKGRETRQG